MLTVIITIVIVILLTIGIVWLIDKFVPNKIKPVITIVLWILIIFLGYITFMSVYGEIKFNELKNKRYATVIERLKDIRDSQLAYKTVNKRFAKNFDELVTFVDTAQFVITQRRDTTVVDEELTRRYGGVTTTKDSVIVDTLDYVSVKDSLFGADPRYKKMMDVPVGKPGAKFEMQAGNLEGIPFFEAKVKKDVILFDQERNLVMKENQVISVDAVNGDELKVGSMNEVNTNGNWPKNYSKEQ